MELTREQAAKHGELPIFNWLVSSLERSEFGKPISKKISGPTTSGKFVTCTVRMNRRGRVSVILMTHGFYMLGAAFLTDSGRVTFSRRSYTGVVVFRSRDIIKALSRGACRCWLFEI